MNQSLYEIGEDLAALEDLLLEVEGDVTGQEEAIDAFLAEMKGKEAEKFTGYRQVIANISALAEAAANEAKRLQAIAKARTNAVDQLKRRLFTYMQLHGLDRVETPLGVFRVQNAGGARIVDLDPRVEEFPEELPEGYRKVVFSPDKVAIRKALEAGEDIDFASLRERGKILVIS